MTHARPMFPPRVGGDDDRSDLVLAAVAAAPLQAAPEPVYVRTDISPADLFKALGDARNEAAAAIEQLIAILDLIDGNCDLEPAGDELDADADSEDDADSEPVLGAAENHPHTPVPSFCRKRILRHSDRSGDQSGWGDQGNNDDREGSAGHDDREGDELEHGGESEREDDEWSGDEHEPNDSGIGDADGLLEQLGSQNGNVAFRAE